MNDAPNLALTPDNGVQLVFRGKLAERAPVLGQQRRSRSARAALLFVGLVIVVHHLKDGFPDEIEVGAQRRQHPCRRIAALPRQSQKDMLGADIFMLELMRFLDGELHDALRTGRIIRIVRRALRCGRNAPDASFRLLELDAELREDMRRHAFPLVQNAQQQMFRSDMAFAPFQCFSLREFQRRDGVGRKLIVAHGEFSCVCAPPDRICRTTAARFLSISVCERLSFPARFFK